MANNIAIVNSALISGASGAYANNDPASVRARQLHYAALKAQTGGKQPYAAVPNEELSGLNLVPTNNNGSETSIINIVQDYSWTFSKFREEVPRIQLIEKQIKNNQHIRFLLNNAANLLNTTVKDPYEGLYALAEPTGFQYIFPYISISSFKTSAQWSKQIPAHANLYGEAANAIGGKLYDAIKKSSGSLGNMLPDKFNLEKIQENVALASAFTKDDPYVGMESPAYFQGPTTQTYSITFPLFNTVSTESANQNYHFVKLFTYQNLFNRKSLTTYDPPVMYECLDVPGYAGVIGHKPAMYISKFDVKNIGAMHAIPLGGTGTRVSIPEAYMISMSLSELIATSRQIFSSVLTGDSIVNVGAGPKYTERHAEELKKDARALSGSAQGYIIYGGVPGLND